MDIVSPNYQKSNCGFVTTSCEEDACLIDLFYLKAISQHFTENSDQTAQMVTSSGTCTPTPNDLIERTCRGVAPDVEIARVSRLEQLLRILTG